MNQRSMASSTLGSRALKATTDKMNNRLSPIPSLSSLLCLRGVQDKDIAAVAQDVRLGEKKRKHPTRSSHHVYYFLLANAFWMYIVPANEDILLVITERKGFGLI